MFEKGKRERRQSEEDKIFNRMLLWLAGAVAVELLLLLLKKAYVDMVFGPLVANGLLTFFKIYTIAGIVVTVGCAVWTVLSARGGKGILLPLILALAAAWLWVVAVLGRFFYADGVRLLMLLPAGAAVLIVIFFLYQRPFFYNAALTGGGMLALWLHQNYYMDHPRMMTACVAAGVVVLIAAALLALQMKKNDGKLGGLRVLPPSSNYLMTWLTCGVTAIVMVLSLVLGVSLSHYLLYVLVGWLFAQAVFFTVKMM